MGRLRNSRSACTPRGHLHIVRVEQHEERIAFAAVEGEVRIAGQPIRAMPAQTCAEIERLERTPRTEQRFEETFDLYPWLLAPALACALFFQLARAFPFRRLA